MAKQLGEGTGVRMLSYNGSIPGPTLKVQQGSEIVVNVTNEGDLETTCALARAARLENKFDGVPTTRPRIPIGGSPSYRIQFPDPACTGTTPTSVRTTPRSWACTATSRWFPLNVDYWPTARRTSFSRWMNICWKDGRIAPFSRTETSSCGDGPFRQRLSGGRRPGF